MILLFAGAALSFAAHAQLTLTGTSYTQNFDNIGTALPTGWMCYTGASATALGTDVTGAFVNTPGNTTVWNYTSGNFRNVASANGFTYFADGTATAQNSATDRALGVRQVSATNTGVAFVLEIANTTGLSNFNLSFKLQSLDSTSPRTTTWLVDYGTGATPSTFTPATAVGTVTTGGNTYSNNTVTVNFGNALDNQAGPVYIRIATLTTTTGSGNRATSAIDDYQLTWNSGNPAYNPLLTYKSPTGGFIPVGTNLMMVFDRHVSAGAGNIMIKNETDQTTQTIAASAATLNNGTNGDTVTVSGITLATGKMYHVTFDSTAFDTAGYKAAGIYDTTAWVFSTLPNTVTSLNENFDASCGASPSNLPYGWYKYSVVGPGQIWNCTATYGNNGTPGVQINGYSGGNNANEDWLISPKLNLSAMSAAYLRFDEWKKYSGDELTVAISSDYPGYGDPTATGVNWIDLAIPMSASDTAVWKTYESNITSNASNPIYVAFKYISTTTSGYQMTLDNVLVSSTSLGISNVSKASLNFTVLGNATTNAITLGYDMKEAGTYNLAVYDLAGRKVYSQSLNITTGAQRTTISGMNLTPGMYLIKLDNGHSFGVAKAIVE